MASSTGLICNECITKRNSSAATTWCPECCKSLCASCKRKHKRSNISINHKTISIEDFQKLPSFVSKLTVHCDKHKIKYEKYCPDHQLLLCKKCEATAHKKCKGLISFDQVTKNTNSSVAFDNMRKSIEGIQLKFENIKQNRSDNLTSVQKQIKDIQREMLKFRSQLNTSLDNMEKELIVELENVEQKTKSQMTILQKDLQEHENKIEEIKNGIDGLEKYGTDFQTFIAGNQLQHIVHQEEEYLQSLLDKKVLENVIIKYNTESNLQKFESKHVNIGHISVETLPSNISIFRGNYKEVQLPVKSTFSQLPISQRFRVKTIPSNVCNVIAMCVLPNMDMVFIGRKSEDFKQQYTLIVHDCNGLFKCSFHIENVYDTDVVASVDDRTVVLNDNKDRKDAITFIDIFTKKAIRTLYFKSPCKGIAKSNDALYCSLYYFGIYKVSLLNFSMTELYNSKEFYSMSPLATFGDKIYYAQTGNDKVFLLSTASHIVWTYTNKMLLGSPWKATFDKQGNIYVVGESTYKVVFISHDGKQSRPVLSKEDGIMNTMSIDFDLNRNRLIVVSFLGDVVIYNCS